MPLQLYYRPETFDEFFGNDAELKKLITMLERNGDDKQHSYLFQGPRGCGKTTLARIAAKMCNCHDMDITEIDIAQIGIKGSAIDIKNSMMYKPLSGKSKAYILDEAHMGNKNFYNAMLKPLEEPPEHVYFFLCTTEPQDIIKTVRSRCMTISVQPLSDDKMLELLNYIKEEEQADTDEKYLKKIVERSEGIPREALIMYDTVIDLDRREIASAIETMQTQESQIKDLCQALLKRKSWSDIVRVLNGLKEDQEKVRWAVLGYMNAVLLNSKKDNSFTDTACSIIDEFSEPFYNTGKAGLIKACYMSIVN
jgi:DNA polymerase III subunit gamma/tau